MQLAEKIRTKLDEILDEEAIVQLIDDRGDGYHFSLTIVSKIFEGQNRIKRSQMIHAALDDLLKSGELHALQLKLKTPEENGQN